MIANASHELRTPLAALQVELELADRDAATAADLRAAIRRARGAVYRLVQLSDGLLEVSAVDSDASLVTGDVDVQSLLDHAAGQVRQTALKEGREIVVLPAELVVDADEAALDLRATARGCG